MAIAAALPPAVVMSASVTVKEPPPLAITPWPPSADALMVTPESVTDDPLP